MPAQGTGTKRYYKKRRYRRKRHGGKGKYWLRQIPWMTRTLKKLIKLTNVEMKHHDETQTSAATDYNGTIYTINDPAQGDTDVTRDGDSLKNQKVNLSLIAYPNGAQAKIRIIVFMDKQNTISTGADYWGSNFIGTAFAPLGFKNHDTRFETRKVWDSGVVDLHPADSEYQNYTKKLVLPLNFHTQFEAGTTTINSGALKIFVVSDKITTNEPTIGYVSRLFFTDN